MSKVEAAGIEPASRDISTEASTCVVAEFGFAPPAPRRQGSVVTSQELYFAASVPDSDWRLVGIVDGLLGRPDVSPQPGLP
jgi:hypothetical protein